MVNLGHRSPLPICRHSERRWLARPSGFTLIELLIVLGIIGLLVGVVIPAAARFLSRGRDEAAEADQRTIEAAISAYYLDPANGQQWPTKNGTAGAFGTTSTVIDIALLTTRNYLRDVPSTASTLNHGSGEGNLTWYVREDGKVDSLEAVTPNSAAAPVAAGSVDVYTSIVLDSNGFPVISYQDETSKDLKILHCGDANCTSGNSIATPDTAGDVGRHSSIALDANGFPVVSYLDRTNEDLKVLHCGNANCTSGNSIVAPDTGIVGYFTSIALDANGFPVVSYIGVSILKVLHCGSANCTGNSIATPDAAIAADGGHTSIALDGSGFPVVSYFDGTGDDLAVLHCGNANCTSDNSLTTPDTGGSVGHWNSLALDASGLPVVGYYDATNADLKLLRCGDANCTSGNSIVAPDTSGFVGEFSSIALDAAGFPVVSYRDTTNLDLKVLHCGNSTCTSGNSIVAADSGGHVGDYNSITLDARGFPVISYVDTTNGNLKVLHCGNPNC